MRSSSTVCTTTRPRRASLASCQRRTPPTPSDTPDLTGMPQTIQQTAALWIHVTGAWEAYAMYTLRHFGDLCTLSIRCTDPKYPFGSHAHAL